MYYALSDSFTGDNPKTPTKGFANTKIVIAFHSKKERKKWLETTLLLTAQPLTRGEALKRIKPTNTFGDDFDRIKCCALYNAKDDTEMHILQGWNI